MHIPESLAPLFENGTIERVVRPLMSGKEAQVFLVVSRGELCVAKVYKEAHNRSFKNRAEYTEGRKTRNSRDQRAIEKRSQHGRAQDEAAWKSTEVDMIHRLHAGGVRVPIPKAYIDGVLVMECVVDAEGNPAPRLGEIPVAPADAREIYDRVIREAVRMLAVGVVHGDLSPFNVLIGADGPVIIDFPQSVDAAGNTNARRLLLRDIENFHRFLQGCLPHVHRLPYAEEMWELYEQNALTADTRLSGRYVPTQRRASDESVLNLIQDANYDERRRRDALGIKGGPRVPAIPPPVYQSRSNNRPGSGNAMVLTPRGASPEPTSARPPEQRPDQRPQHGPPQPWSQQSRPQHGQQPRPQHQGHRPQQQGQQEHQGQQHRPPQQDAQRRPPQQDAQHRPPQQDAQHRPQQQGTQHQSQGQQHQGPAQRPQQQQGQPRQGQPHQGQPQRPQQHQPQRPQQQQGQPQRPQQQQGQPQRPQQQQGQPQRPQQQGQQQQQRWQDQRPREPGTQSSGSTPQPRWAPRRQPAPGAAPSAATDPTVIRRRS